MAFLKTSKLFMRQLLKTEVMFNKVMKESIPISKAADKYIEKIRNENFPLNKRIALDLFEFPYPTFSKINQKSWKNIITETYNILKEKGLSKDPSVIIKVLRCYSDKRVDIDMETVLKEISDNEVAFDENICDWMIMRYSNHGEMKAVEILLNEMKSKGIQCFDRGKCWIVSGYIIAGQPEQAENFIKENNLNMKSQDVLYSRCYGYASIGDVASLKKLLGEIKENDIQLSDRRYCNLYEQLVYADVDSSQLNEILDMTKPNLGKISSKLYALIATLNSADQFNYSLIIVEKLFDLVDSPMGFIDLFGYSKCPVNTYKQVLTLLMPHCKRINYTINIFKDLDFEFAFDICHKFVKTNKWKVIYYSILNKAISDKSLVFIEKALHFIVMNLQWWQINLVLHQMFLPSMLENGLMSKYEESLDLFPEFKNQLLPVILLKYLCSGDFSRYNELLTKHNNRRFYVVYNMDYLANEISNNFGWKDIKKLSVEAGKCLDEIFINNMLSAIFIKEVKKLSNNQTFNEIEELIEFGKEWNVELTKSNMDNLILFNPDIAEFIRSSMVVKNDFIVKDSSVS